MTVEYRPQRRPERADNVCRRLASQQFGIVTREQALDAGLSAEAIQRRIAGGTFERLYRGVYRMAGAQPSWEQDLFAAQEWA
ncbi:MAG: type IV toxin-antitoxin system AbiEi family antitoxin domain-containing protein, partial [Actinomycetota bacterium]